MIAIPAGRRSGLAIVVDPGLDPIGEPRPLVTHLYERLPQIGARTLRRFGSFELAFEGELNRFAKPVDIVDPDRFTGLRTHALATLARPWITPGWNLTPRLTLNAAAYALDQPMEDGRRNASNVRA